MFFDVLENKWYNIIVRECEQMTESFILYYIGNIIMHDGTNVFILIINNKI